MCALEPSAQPGVLRLPHLLRPELGRLPQKTSDERIWLFLTGHGEITSRPALSSLLPNAALSGQALVSLFGSLNS